MKRLFTAVLLVVAGMTAPTAQATPGSTNDVIVQLFEWNWQSVGRECGSYLGPHGYGWVQVSPPEEHVRGQQWWTEYQPVSYQIESRKGTRAQFKSMVDACHAAGVKVLVDAVFNHMTGQDTPGTGWAGSSYSHYNYPGMYQTQDFHHCGRNGNDDIVNYGDRWEVQNCQLVHLADLATDTEYVRGRIAGYLNDLLSLGADGFRVDAAKHMAAGDIAAIKAKLSRQPYMVQEVIFGAGEPIQPGEYTGNGDVHEFRYGRDLKRMFQTDKIKFLNNFGEPWGYLRGASSVSFVDNHDTERNGSTLSYKDGATYALANAFMLAWTYGTPTVMSGYAFGGNDQGPPQDSTGRITDATCSAGTWTCEHRLTRIGNMVGFHNAVRGTAVADWWDDGDNLIAFSRGDKGFLTLDNENGASTRTFQTHLPAGKYCDVLHGEPRNGTCTGPSYSVDGGGRFTATVGAHDGIALHVNART